MSRRPLRRCAGLALAAALLAACSTGGPADAGAPEGSNRLTLQLSWVKNKSFIGEYAADADGHYAAAGLPAVTMVPGPSTGVAELLSGTADVALSGPLVVGEAIAQQQAPLKIIGVTSQRSPQSVLSLTDRANIRTPADLVGKRIGVQDINVGVFRALLAANGIDPASVTVVPVQYDPAPLLSGEVDGFIAYTTDESAELQVEGHRTTDLLFADHGLPTVAGTITVTDQAIAENRARLKAFLVAEIQGWGDAIADPARAAQLGVDVYGKDLGLNATAEARGAELLAQLAVSPETARNGLLTVSAATQAETISSLARVGISVPADRMFDMSLLDEVYAEHPELRRIGVPPAAGSAR